MSNVEKWNPGVAPGMSAARLNEPFHVVSAIYDAVDDEIDVIIGHGRAQNGNGVVDLNTSDTTIYITSPVVSTTYYIFYNSDGTFTYSTTAKPVINTIILASVLSNNPLGGATTITDVRNLLQSPAFIKSMYDADGDTGIQVEESADEDKIRFDAAGTQEAQIDSDGLTLKTGASVNEFSTDGTLAGNSDDAVPTEKAVKTRIDGIYNDRGDLANFDFSSLTTDGAEHSLDLSSIVPVGTKAVLLRVILLDDAADSSCQFYQKSSSQVQNVLSGRTQVANQAFEFQGWVAVNSSRTIYYNIENLTWTAIYPVVAVRVWLT